MLLTEAELVKNFESLEDEQLLALSADSSELTELALSVLKAELRRRRLQPAFSADAEQADNATHPDDQRVVTVRRFDSLPEAMAARAALEAAGIECFLRDENAVRTMWHLSTFLGGTRLDVLEEDLPRAEAALIKVDAAEAGIPFDENPDQIVENAYLCPACGSWDVNRVTPTGGLATIAGWITGRNNQAKDQEWKCNECSAIWIDNDRD